MGWEQLIAAGGPLAGSGAALLPGLAFYDVVGHSIPGGGGVTNGDWNGYVDKLMFLLGTPRRKRNLAVGGAVSCWQSARNLTGDGGFGHVLGNLPLPPALGAGSGPYLPQSDIAMMHHALNDLASLGQGNPQPMQEAHRVILSRLVASAFAGATDSSFARSGTWSQAALGGFGSPAGWYQTSTVGDFVVWSIPADYPGGRTVSLNLLLNPAHDLTIGVVIDGVAQPDVRLQGAVICDQGGPGGSTPMFNMKCLRYALPAAGAHTIRLTLKAQGVGGSVLYLDSGVIESDPADGPIIVVPTPHRTANSNYSLWSAPAWKNAAGMSDAAVQAWTAALRSVAGEFPHTLVVDIDAPLGAQPGNFIGDFTHPNDAGHGIIARAIYDALQASGLLTSRRASRVSPALGQFWIPVGQGINSYPQFQNSWVNFGAPYPSAGFYKDAYGIVRLQGVVKSGSSAAAVIFTLPSGYRPAANKLFATGANPIAQMQVDSSGNVSATNFGNTAATVLDGIQFPAEQ